MPYRVPSDPTEESQGFLTLESNDPNNSAFGVGLQYGSRGLAVGDEAPAFHLQGLDSNFCALEDRVDKL